MFNLENFHDYPELLSPLKKINKYMEKEKLEKLKSKLEDLKSFLDDEKLQVPVTYILSILAELYSEILDKSYITRIRSFLTSQNEKVKLNSSIILGFYLLNHPQLISSKNYGLFFDLLQSEHKDIRDNSYIFLEKMIKENSLPISEYTEQLLQVLQFEIAHQNSDNILLLFDFLSHCNTLGFKEVYFLREELLNIIDSPTLIVDSDQLKSKLVSFIREKFPEIEAQLSSDTKQEELTELLQKTFIMRSYDFAKLQKDRQVSFKDFLEEFKSSTLPEKEIYFYTTDQHKTHTYFYELEKNKLLEFFEQNTKISIEEIVHKFSRILDSSRVKAFLKILLKLGYIRGYLSELFFYPMNFIYTSLKVDLDTLGEISLKNYNYLPLKLISKCIKEIAKTEGKIILISKEKDKFYDLAQISRVISEKTTKDASIDLQEYREKLTRSSFIRLVKYLPKDYLTTFHKGTSWLTNIGKLKFEQELENSKLIGFFDIDKVSQKLNMSIPLLEEVFNTYMDKRSGIWNIDRIRFYYSKYIKSKLENLDKIQDADEKASKMTQLARSLQIEYNTLQNELDEKRAEIIEEIKTKDTIKISKYKEKLGMEEEAFMEFINAIGVTYLRKGDLLILNPSKIDNAKSELKEFIKKEFTSKDFISLGNYDVNSSLLKNLIEDLQESEKINGIFYEEEDGLKFYTERGIKNMMLSETFIFSLYDFFYEKELTEEELQLLKEIFYELYESGKLQGQFDEETLTFSNNEIIFANDYNTTFHEFNRRVSEYIEKFNREFQKIKQILTKKSTITAKEIKWIEDTINKINKRDIYWKNELVAFTNRVNEELLKKQGVSRKYLKRAAYTEQEESQEIRIFADDEDVIELMEGFNLWMHLYNKLEQKYQNVIFYQKRLMLKPQDSNTQEKLRELRIELNLVD